MYIPYIVILNHYALCLNAFYLLNTATLFETSYSCPCCAIHLVIGYNLIWRNSASRLGGFVLINIFSHKAN